VLVHFLLIKLFYLVMSLKPGLPHTQGTQGIQGNTGNFQVVENLRETQGISGKFELFFKLREVLNFFF